jgi:hypothetical protein
MYSPLAHFTDSWLRYRTATHWMWRVPSSVPPSPCSHHLPPLQVPGQDTGQLPTGRGGSHLLCRHHHVLSFAPFTGSWSRYWTATHWTRRVPSSVPPSPCSHHLPPYLQVPDKILTVTHWTRWVPSSVPPSPCTHPLAHFTGSWSRYRTATRWTRRVPSSVTLSPCTHPLLTLQVPGQDTGQLPTGRGRSHLLCRHHHVPLLTGRCVIAASLLKLTYFGFLT